MGLWFSGKIILDTEFNDVRRNKASFYNQHSNIPSFHVLGRKL